MNIHKNTPKSQIPSDKFVNEKPIHDTVETPAVSPTEPDSVQYASYPASMINLLKTIIGSGILSLPYAIDKFGLILGVGLMFFAAALATFGLHILNVAAMQIGRKSSFAGLCSISYPKAAFAFEFAIAIKCIGAAIAYMSVIGATTVKLCVTVFNIPENPESIIATLAISKFFWVAFFALSISPVCFMKKMDSLKYTSYAGMGAVAYLVVLTVVNFYSQDGSSFSNIRMLPVMSISTLSKFGTFIFAYTCHQNILPIQNEARNNTPRGMMNIIAFSMTTATILYLLVAVYGAATYGSSVLPSILDNFPDGIFFNIARVFYVLLLLFSFPLQVFPCRTSIEKMTLFYMRAERLPSATSTSLYIFSTAGIIAVTSVVASFQINLDTVLSIVGAVAGSFICYFLPSILFNKIFEGTPWNWRRVGSYILLVSGVVVFILSSVGIVTNFIK